MTDDPLARIPELVERLRNWNEENYWGEVPLAVEAANALESAQARIVSTRKSMEAWQRLAEERKARIAELEAGDPLDRLENEMADERVCPCECCDGDGRSNTDHSQPCAACEGWGWREP